MQKVTNIDVKRINRRNVARYIFAKKTTSRQQISYDLRISIPTVLQIVKELQSRGLICEVGQYTSTGGRKAVMIGSAPEARYVVGVDITRHHIGVVLLNLGGDVVDLQRIRCNYTNKKEYYMNLGQLVDEFVEKNRIPTEKVLGVGVSLPGTVNEEQTTLIDSYVLDVYDIPTCVFSQNIHYPCYFLNDANAGGLSEIFGENSNKTMMYLSLSNSIGGAVFINGKLSIGENCRCGEFGHMRLVPGGKVCYCGQAGCVDAYCSALRLLELGDNSLEMFFEQLDKKEPDHVKFWEEYLNYLALTIVNLQMAFDSDIVLGGYVGAWLQPWLADLNERVDRLSPFKQKKIVLKAGRFRNEAAAYGVATCLIERYFNEL